MKKTDERATQKLCVSVSCHLIDSMVQESLDNLGYNITDTKLGEGAQGIIVSGTDNENQDVAIKLINFKSKRGKAQFQYEKFITSRLIEAKPEGICEFQHVESSEEWGIVIMKQYESDMFNYLFEGDREAKLEENMAKSVFSSICTGLKALHSQGIAHLDVKLENILFNISSKEPFICDFGSSIYIPQTDGETLFKAYGLGVRGTFEYYAPELIRKERSYDPFKVDIYALGVLLHIMVTGLYPYLIKNPIRIAQMDVVKKEVSPACVKLIKSMLHRTPSKRPTISQVLQDPWLKATSFTYNKTFDL